MKEIIKNMLRESLDKSTITKLSVFDFDGTLIDTALPDEGKVLWKEKTGKDWPHVGWWSKKESLDPSVFENPVIPETIAAYNKEKSNPNTLMVMLTGRMTKLGNEVKSILDSKGLTFDVYDYNRGGSTVDSKIKSLDRLLVEYPNIKEVAMWDDRIEHVPSFENWGQSKPNINFSLTLIKGNHH